MDNKEAITILNGLFNELECKPDTSGQLFALNKAIDALEKAEEQKLSDEQIVLRKIETHKTFQWVSVSDKEVIVRALQNVPRKGAWVVDMYGDHICPFCKGTRRDSRLDYTNFCNKCGADLRGVQGE